MWYPSSKAIHGQRCGVQICRRYLYRQNEEALLLQLKNECDQSQPQQDRILDSSNTDFCGCSATGHYESISTPRESQQIQRGGWRESQENTGFMQCSTMMLPGLYGGGPLDLNLQICHVQSTVMNIQISQNSSLPLLPSLESCLYNPASCTFLVPTSSASSILANACKVGNFCADMLTLHAFNPQFDLHAI